MIFYFGGGAPTLVALFLVFKTYPNDAKRDYFSRCFNLKRMGFKWPLFTVAYFAIIAIIGLLINTLFLGYGKCLEKSRLFFLPLVREYNKKTPCKVCFAPSSWLVLDKVSSFIISDNQDELR